MSDRDAEQRDAAILAILAAIGQLAPILNVHTELLRHIIRLAEPTPDEGSGVVEILLRIERMLTVQNALLRRVVERTN